MRARKAQWRDSGSAARAKIHSGAASRLVACRHAITEGAWRARFPSSNARSNIASGWAKDSVSLLGRMQVVANDSISTKWDGLNLLAREKYEGKVVVLEFRSRPQQTNEAT